jgi:DNA-binding MarR family transcriptional regulator
MPPGTNGQARGWALFTTHAVVMAYVIQHHDSTVRQIASDLGITERATLSILGDLDAEGIIDRHRDGRSNTYSVNFGALAAFRRSSPGPPTPATFADTLINALLDLSHYRGSKRPPRRSTSPGQPRPGRSWGFFSNHLRILLSIAAEPPRTAHQLSERVGITERAVVAILKQLEEENILERTREGRRNLYAVNMRGLRSFARWSPARWPLPREVVEASLDGIDALTGIRVS